MVQLGDSLESWQHLHHWRFSEQHKALSNVLWLCRQPCSEQEVGLETSRGPSNLIFSVIQFLGANPPCEAPCKTITGLKRGDQ